MIDVLKKVFLSRKWTGAVVGFLLPILNAKFGWGLSEDQVTQAIMAIAAVILGESFIDGKRAENGYAPKPPAS